MDAQATVWGLTHDHGSAIPSGSTALERLRFRAHEKVEKKNRRVLGVAYYRNGL